jgi:hypothetical protein
VHLGTLAAGWAVVATLLTIAAPAYAADKPYSAYELEAIAEGLDAEGLERENAPEGKTIESIVVRRLDVFEPRDPLPAWLGTFLDGLHATSRPFMIERELLVREGQPYDQRRVDETARNLRQLRQLSLVLCVPTKGSTADSVRLLVITKDIWSLRLNSDFRLANGGVETLLLAPSEENLGGLHHAASAMFLLEPDTYSVGGTYRVPRIGRSFHQASLNANVIVGRASGAIEGGYGLASYGQPLYTTRTKWAWAATIAWRVEIERFFRGLDPLRFDADATPTNDALPIEYHAERIAGRYGVTRSWGYERKHDVSFGAEARRTAFRPTVRFERADTRARDEFIREQVPVGDDRVYPFVGYASYSTDFKSFVDVNTLSLQEDYRVGHEVYAKLYPVFEPLSSRDYLGAAGGAAYTTILRDGLVRAYASGLLEASATRVWDASVTAGLRLVSPRLGFGRLVLDGATEQRLANYLNERTAIGGEGRLRGYPSGAYRGESVVVGNLELRTPPLELWTVQLGGVAFVDAGAASDPREPFDARMSVGLGARVLFPQLERSVMRLDWGFPLEPDPSVGVDGPWPGRFVLTFRQAFPMPTVAPPSVFE